MLRFEFRLERWRPEAKGGWKERGAPEEAGGLLYDIGSHLIDQALHLFGPVRDVYAELDIRRPGMEVDDDVFLALTHDNGVRSHLWTSCMAAQPGPRMRVMGDHGRLRETAGRSAGTGIAGWQAPGPKRLGRRSAGALGNSG